MSKTKKKIAGMVFILIGLLSMAIPFSYSIYWGIWQLNINPIGKITILLLLGFLLVAGGIYLLAKSKLLLGMLQKIEANKKHDETY